MASPSRSRSTATSASRGFRPCRRERRPSRAWKAWTLPHHPPHRLPHPLRLQDLGLRTVLQHLPHEPRGVGHLERHHVAAVVLLATTWIALLEPARDAGAEGHLRRHHLLGAQQIFGLPDRLEQHLRPEVRGEELGLEHPVRPEVAEVARLLAPRDEVPAPRRFDDLVHVDHAPRRLTRGAAVDDLELAALVARPARHRKPLLELLARRRADGVRGIHELGGRRRKERLPELPRDGAPAAGAREPEQQRQTLLAREVQRPPKRAEARDREPTRNERHTQAREPVPMLPREAQQSLQIRTNRLLRYAEPPRGGAIRHGLRAVTL